MAHEQIKVTVASGASTSGDASFSRVYPMYGVEVGTMSTGVVWGIHQSTDGGSTFKQVMNPPNPLTATVTNLTLQVGTNVGVGGGFVVVPGGFKYAKIVLTGVVSGGVSFNIIGFDR
jgi:hypothetical protein